MKRVYKFWFIIYVLTMKVTVPGTSSKLTSLLTWTAFQVPADMNVWPYNVYRVIIQNETVWVDILVEVWATATNDGSIKIATWQSFELRRVDLNQIFVKSSWAAQVARVLISK